MISLHAIAAIVHDKALRHPGVLYVHCENPHCRAQAIRIAELIRLTSQSTSARSFDVEVSNMKYLIDAMADAIHHDEDYTRHSVLGDCTPACRYESTHRRHAVLCLEEVREWLRDAKDRKPIDPARNNAIDVVLELIRKFT